MPPAPRQANETHRLAALARLAVLDSEPEPEFDALVRVASLVCGTPISLISLVDDHRQWFKANVGLAGTSETPRDLAFCDHAIAGEDILEIPDATADSRVADNALVTGAPHIRFYAGAPLRLSDGSGLGTLCVIDRTPRRLDATQREILRCLAQSVTGALENRRGRLAEEQAERTLAEERQRLANVIAATGAGTWEWNVQTGALKLNASWADILGHTLDALTPASLRTWLDRIHPDDLLSARTALEQHVAGRTDHCECEFRMRHQAGHFVWAHIRGTVMARTADGAPLWMVGILTDISERKRRDDALRKSEDFLQRIGRVGGVGGWDLDLRTGTLHWSIETHRIHGVDPGYQPTLADAINFYAPEARPLIRAAVEQGTVGGAPWDLELPLIRADGRRIWVRSMGAASFAEGRPVRLSGALQDVTDRVAERQALRDANERFKLATDSGRIGVWDWDLTNDRMRWDATMHRLYGLAPHDGPIDHAVWRRHLHPEDAAATEQALLAGRSGSKPYDTEFRVVWSNASVHHLRGTGRVSRDAAGRATRMVGANWDVTEERRLAAELTRQIELRAEAAERETALFRNSPDSLFIVGIRAAADATQDGPEFVYEAVSPAFAWFAGWLPEDLVGQRPQDCLPPDVAQTLLKQFRACLAEGGSVAYSATHNTPLGQREFEGALTPIHHPTSGRIVRLAGALRDVTDRNRMQEEAHHDQKMKLVGRLAAGVAHDFNNILQSISGCLELVLDTTVPGTAAHEYVSIGLRSANRGAYLTHHLLSYARKQMLLPQSLALPGLLADFRTLLERTLGPNIDIRVRHDPAIPLVNADPGQLQTALLNLAINSAHAMPDGGSLVVDLRAIEEEGEHWVVITVTDTGTGMDAATAAQAVEPFFSTKGLNGTGLGLSMVQGFAVQSGGRLGITSTPGQGTIVELRLPAAFAAAPLPIPAEPETLPDGAHLLLVDDDPDVLATLAAFLELAGFRIIKAGNAQEALGRLAEGPPVDAVVTDYAMPGDNGSALIAQARLVRPDLPAIIISGFADLAQGEALGEGVAVLHKPFQRQELIAALRQVLGLAQAAASPPVGACPDIGALPV